MIMESWYNITKKFNCVPYNLGSYIIEDGLDCMTTLFRFIEAYGADISKFDNDEYYFEYKGKKLNRNNYSQLLSKEAEMNDVLLQLIRKEFKKTNKLIRGNICISSLLDVFPVTIYLGHRNHLIVTKEYGNKIIKLLDSKILEIYTWPKQE